MSIGPLSSAAGSQLAQTSGSDVNRANQDTASQQRKVASVEQAQKSAGIGETEQDQEASDRDADGRKLWEETAEGPADESNSDAPEEKHSAENKQSRDATGNSGNNLDLTG